MGLAQTTPLRPRSETTMHEGTLLALEFDRVVAAVRSLALTPLGATALDRLTPQTDADRVAATLSATSEGVAYLEANAPFGLDAPPELELIVALLAVEGRVVEPRQLMGLARFLASMDAACSAFGNAAGGPYPALEAVIDSTHSFEQEVSAIRAAIDPEGEVLDDASPKLRTLRDRLRRQRNRLRGTLESYLRGRDTAKYLQERVVTERGGRFVLVVRSEHRAAIPGIVHGSSGSGASLFLEPLSTVEINNDIVALEESESEEVHRILLGLAEPHSGTTQFYVNLADNLDLNPRPTRWGYAVFGMVVEGMDVVDEIGHAPTGAGGEFDRGVPVNPIVIENVVLLIE